MRIIADNLAAFVLLKSVFAAAGVRYAMSGTIGLQAHGISVIDVCHPDIVIDRRCRHVLQLLRDYGWMTEQITSSTTDVYLADSDPANGLTLCFDTQPELTNILATTSIATVAGEGMPVLSLSQIATVYLLSERGHAAALARLALVALGGTEDVHLRLQSLQGLDAGSSNYILRSFNRHLAARRLAAFADPHARV